MLPSVLSLKVGAIACAAALAIGAATGGWLAHLFYAPRLELAATKLRQANERIETLGKDIERQNKAVSELQAAAKERAAQAEKALQAAQAARDQAEADAQQLLSLRPPAGVEVCKAASDLIRKELGR